MDERCWVCLTMHMINEKNKCNRSVWIADILGCSMCISREIPLSQMDSKRHSIASEWFECLLTAENFHLRSPLNHSPPKCDFFFSNTLRLGISSEFPFRSASSFDPSNPSERILLLWKSSQESIHGNWSRFKRHFLSLPLPLLPPPQHNHLTIAWWSRPWLRLPMLSHATPPPPTPPFSLLLLANNAFAWSLFFLHQFDDLNRPLGLATEGKSNTEYCSIDKQQT